MRPMVPRTAARRPPQICGSPHVTAGCGRQRQLSPGHARAADRLINFAEEPACSDGACCVEEGAGPAYPACLLVEWVLLSIEVDTGSVSNVRLFAYSPGSS